MPEPTEPVTPPLRTWRPMAAWTAAILLALGLTWFVGAVVVPVWQVRRELRIVTKVIHPRGCVDYDFSTSTDRLGGPEQAAGKIALYAKLPRSVAPYRAEAAALLGACGGAAVGCLRRLLKDEDPEVRAQAATALAMPEVAQAVIPSLVDALHDDNREVRGRACGALGRLGPVAKDAIPEIKALLQDADTCWGACSALGQMGSEAASAVPELTELLTHKDEDARFSAALALGEIGPVANSAEPILRRIADDTKEAKEVRKAAAEALKKIRGEEPPK